MGGSSSSLLDENKCNYIRGRAEAELKNFSPHYRRQYAVAFFRQLHDEVEQHRTVETHLLKHRQHTEPGKVLHEEVMTHYSAELKKWKEHYVLVRADYSLEIHENYDSFLNGTSPKIRLLPAGGAVLMSEDQYTALADRFFPDPSGVSEEKAPPIVSMPDQFPVYLWQPYQKHSYFCFHGADSQKSFAAALGDCIRHQNHDYHKKTKCEVRAFLEAVQFYRQEKGHYGSWEMLIGKDVQVLSNLVMEELLPSLQTELLPKMKGKKNDRKRAWFATIEDAYNVVMSQVSTGLSALEEECRGATKQQEGLIRSDMDQIINSKNFLAGKLKATVSQPALKCCMENVQPYLSSILEELMGPISSGFSEIRFLFETEVNKMSKDYQESSSIDKLKKGLAELGDLPFTSLKMQPCYRKVDVLCEHLQELRNRFKFSNTDRLVQITQNYMQQIMDNVVHTFEQLLSNSLQGDPSQICSAIEKVKQRVLKQYDYDSSTLRKKLFQEALVEITMPTMQKSLAPSCKPELQRFEQYIFADYTNFIQVEHVYEEIILQTLLSEIDKVVKEAANMKKHNLFVDSIDFPFESQSSLTDSKTLPGSIPASPAKHLVPPIEDANPQAQGNGVPESQDQPSKPEPALPEAPESIVPAKNDQQEPSAVGIDPGITINAESLTVNMASLDIANEVEEEKTQEHVVHKEIQAPDNLKEIRDLITVVRLEDPGDRDPESHVELLEQEESILKEELRTLESDRPENNEAGEESGMTSEK
ncbi:protein Niban 1-like isoform X1 [Acipenser oxyrinchus oxyrinchus]|uniref:Protein Niban 1-like isoform X1 n=1 Tax=Acipenser oxyrinchus oxyrinchus TaxID=40147 RepID=A0AAD8D9X1_ACIOX|nr:protein Niban 1-like isoform X1 [Acipenser oxyrinchus oxyrinchus]